MFFYFLFYFCSVLLYSFLSLFFFLLYSFLLLYFLYPYKIQILFTNYSNIVQNLGIVLLDLFKFGTIYFRFGTKKTAHLIIVTVLFCRRYPTIVCFVLLGLLNSSRSINGTLLLFYNLPSDIIDLFGCSV